MEYPASQYMLIRISLQDFAGEFISGIYGNSTSFAVYSMGIVNVEIFYHV